MTHRHGSNAAVNFEALAETSAHPIAEANALLIEYNYFNVCCWVICLTDIYIHRFFIIIQYIFHLLLYVPNEYGLKI